MILGASYHNYFKLLIQQRNLKIKGKSRMGTYKPNQGEPSAAHCSLEPVGDRVKVESTPWSSIKWSGKRKGIPSFCLVDAARKY